MDFIYEVEDADLRKQLFLMESAEIQMERARLAFHTECALSEIHMHEAEIQCYAESGDVFALSEYYAEADEKTKENKEGLFKTLWQKIKNVWNKIKSFFTGNDPAGKDDDSIEVNGTVWKLGNMIYAAGAEIEKMIQHPIKYWLEGGALDRLKEIAAFAIGGTAVVHVTRKKAQELKDNLKGLIEKVTGPFDQVYGKIETWAKEHGWGKEVDESSGALTKILSKISTVVGAIKTALHKASEKLGIKKDSEEGENPEGDGSSGENTDGDGSGEGKDDNTDDGKKDDKKESSDDKAGTDDGDEKKDDKSGKTEEPKKEKKEEPKNTDKKDENADEKQETENQDTEENKKPEEGEDNGKKKKGAFSRVTDGVKKIFGKGGEEKTESAEDFLADVFGDTSFMESDGLNDMSYMESDDDIDYDDLLDDDMYAESPSVMETVDELTELFDGLI